MRNFHQRFEQKKTLSGVGQIQSPTGLIARQRGKVEICVLASQGKPEGPLPAPVPVTRPHIATAFRKDGHNIAFKRNRVLRRSTGRRKRQTDQGENNGR